MTENLKGKFTTAPQFLYVRSGDNPSDLITRGLSFKEFEKKFSFWTKGPQWLSISSAYWPKFRLTYEEKTPATPIYTIIQSSLQPPVINMAKYSSLTTLSRVCANIFKFYSICKKVDLNPDFRARMYLLKVMQQESFSEEINFLKSAKAGKVPRIVPESVKKIESIFE